MEDKENTEPTENSIEESDRKLQQVLYGETTDVELDEEGNLIEPSDEETVFPLQMNNEDNTDAETPNDTEDTVTPELENNEPVEETTVTETNKPYTNAAAAKNITEEELQKIDASVPKEIVEDYNKAVIVANTEHETGEVLPENSKQEEEKEFALLEMPEFTKKAFKKYDRKEVEEYVTEIINKYNANVIKVEKIHLKSLERKKTISKIFAELSNKRIAVKQLSQKIQELEQKVREQEATIYEVEQKLEEQQNIVEQPVEEIIEETPMENVPEPVSVTEDDTIYKPLVIPVEELEITEEMRLNHAIATKLEEADMKAHNIRLEATTEAAEILAKAQDNAAELMRKAEIEIEELNKATNEAAEKKLAEAEGLKQEAVKILEERNNTHKRLIKLYGQQITRLEKQIKDTDDLIK